MSQVSPRARAVEESLRRILETIKSKEVHESFEELLLKFRPEEVSKVKAEGKIPKWYVELIEVLTKLYDRGHADALGQIDNVRS